MNLVMITLQNGTNIIGSLKGSVSVFEESDNLGVVMEDPFIMLSNPSYPGHNFERYNFDKKPITIMKTSIVTFQNSVGEDIKENYYLKKKLYEQYLDETVEIMLKKENAAFKKLFGDDGKIEHTDIGKKLINLLRGHKESKEATSKKDEVSNIIDFINKPKIH